MGTYTARDRARTALVSLAGGTPDSVSFRHEAIAILDRAIGVDGWGWLLTDPGARLPVHVSGENRVVDQALRRFFRMLPQAWNEPGGPGSQPPRRGLATSGPVTTLSAQTGGDLNRDLSWRWIDRLGVPGPNPAEPLPPHVYVLAAHVAASPQRRSARVRVRAVDGTWMAIRAAALTTGSQAAAGYAITLEAAPADDLAPLLMRAWGLTRREREVARLVIDGLSTEDIAAALFISAHTARDHVRTMFGKVGVSRRQDLAATLPGRTLSPVSRWVTRT